MGFFLGIRIRQKIKDTSFRRKLILTYILIVFLPLSILGFYSYTTAKNELLNQARTNLSENARQISVNISERFGKTSDFIHFIVNIPSVAMIMSGKNTDIIDMLRQENIVETTLWSYLSINKEIREVSFYSRLLDSDVGSFFFKVDTVMNEQWYKDSKEIGKIYWWNRNQKIYITKPMDSINGEKSIGMINVEMNMWDITDIIKKAKGEGEIVIVDDKGEIAFASTNIDVLLPDFKDLASKHNTKLEKRVEGQYFIFSQKIKPLDWKMYYIYPSSSIAMDTSKIIKASVFLSLGILPVIIILAYFLSGSFVKRIKKLLAFMKAVEAGNLDLKIISNSKDEFGELTSGFGRMLGKINELINEVYLVRIKEREAELRALQAQINPHFLYNTLSVIKWKAKDNKNKEVGVVAGLLSRFYRTSLNKGNAYIKIGDEIENIKSYIDIQMIMHGNSFEVEYNIIEDASMYQCVNFILQPIVENAIVHGIDEDESDKRKLLRVSVQLSGEDIEFLIQDNGKGIDEEILVKIMNKTSNSYGLKNVNERIKLCCGEKYGINISSKPQEGTSVSVRVPVIKTIIPSNFKQDKKVI